MPIYEYQCSTCHHTLDALQKMSDAPLHLCPACQQPNLARLVSAAGFQLKGNGWYATDFKASPPVSEDKSQKTEDKGSKVEDVVQQAAADTTV